MVSLLFVGTVIFVVLVVWTDPKNQIPTIHLCLLLIKKILLKSKKSNSFETDVYSKTTKLNANEKLIKP